MAREALIKDFENMLGKENVFSSEADRRTYAYDAAVLNPVVPAFVLRPTTTEQLGFEGREEGISATCVVLLESR